MTLTEYLRIAAIAFVVALFPAGFITGCIDEKERFDAYKSVVAATGKAQEERTADRIASDRATKARVDRDYAARLDRLTRDRADASAKLHEYASRSIVPTIPAPPHGGGAGEANRGIVCFARDRLSEGITASLQRFGGRFGESAQLGAGAISGFQACAGWAIEEAAKPR